CGGGILSESLTTNNNDVYGLDASSESINVAKQHAKQNKLKINYINSTIEYFVTQGNLDFDILTCMEMLEHVPEPESIIASIAKL
ncbi:methyltransferase domain-containing protein, partial [Francisella tularensis subsp. holarctica]|uniref:methyltransferase domain-containing protein n=1 Tax=Francisella tularensis TaxID=263 RepID=UPI002381AB47